MKENKTVEIRNKYFQSLGMGIPPTSSDERLSLAKKLYKKRWGRGLKKSLMLFDPLLDKDNAAWLGLVSKIYFQEGELYNPKAAFILAQRSISLGNNECMPYVINAYANGIEGYMLPAFKKAVALLKTAAKDHFTWESVITCIESFEKNSGLEEKEYYKSKSFWNIADIIERIYIKDNHRKPNLLQRPKIYKFICLSAKAYTEGSGVEQDYDRAQKLYRFINEEANYLDTYLSGGTHEAAFFLAARSLINGEDNSNINIQRYIRHPYSWLDTRLHKYSIKTLANLYNNIKIPEYMEAVKILRPYLHEVGGAQGIINLLDNPEISETTKQQIKHIVTLTNWHLVNWGSLGDLYYVEMFSTLQTHGIDANTVFNNTINYGPFYNPLSTNALPIVGEFLPMFHGGNDDGRQIVNGKGFFTGLSVDDKGEINFSFTEVPNSLIFDEDIDVLLVLAFANKTMLWPSIDVSLGGHFNAIAIRQKITEPAWLLKTELGRTLYATDVLAGELAWSIENFTINDKNENEATRAFKRMKEELSLCAGKRMSSGYLAINVNPKQVDLDKKNINSGDFRGVSIVPNLVSIGVDGFFQTSLGQVKYNAPGYSHTEKTKILTKHFNDIAFIFPVYERLRQIIGIAYSLQELKNTGFKPSDRMNKYIKIKEWEFATRSGNKQTEFANYLKDLNGLKR